MKPSVYTIYLIKICVCDLCVDLHAEPSTGWQQNMWSKGKRKRDCRCSEEVLPYFSMLWIPFQLQSNLLFTSLSWSGVTKLSQTIEGIIWTYLKHLGSKNYWKDKCGWGYSASLCDPSSFFLFQPCLDLTSQRLSITSGNICSLSHRVVMEKYECKYGVARSRLLHKSFFWHSYGLLISLRI